MIGNWLGWFALFCGIFFAAWPAEAQEAHTLRQMIVEHGLAPDPGATRNLDKLITSGAELDDASRFVIAYYLDDGTERLNEPLFLERFDRARGKWQSAQIGEAKTQSQGASVSCNGAILSIKAAGGRLFLETHINPSAGCVLILSPELKLEASLYGWIVGKVGEAGLVYHRSEIHFAPVHPAEIALHDLRTRRDITLFPPKPDQTVRLARIAQLKEFYRTHESWCNKWNDPCDAEQFDSTLEGEVAVNEEEQAIAFVISYEQIQFYPDDEQKPSGPREVLYVYRHVNDDAKIECREMLLADAQAAFGRAPLEKLLEAGTLQRIFARTAAKKSGR
jgi:hypothetical protein